jgi:phage baseplate assembly protein W
VAAGRRSYEVLGRDLALTAFRGVPSAVPLEVADSWGTLDLRMQGSPEQADLSIAAGRENLAQALTLRLLTERGALAALGHPDYGSRLVTLIGRGNSETVRNLARLHVIEAVRQEPRVQALTALSVATSQDSADTLRIALSVVPRGDDEPLALEVEVAL